MLNRVHFGDCRDSLRAMSAAGVKVQMCVTSPPYFGLRDYGHDGQIGLEETPEQYIAELVDVFRCVRDVLTDDGTLWVNIGDSYCSIGHKKSSSGYGTSGLAGGPQTHTPLRRENNVPGLKHKDLIGIPWMLAFALRADGWYLRQDIIWHKPNPMPESVRDRCTKSHEYMFLLSKSPRYFYDHEAVFEDALTNLPIVRKPNSSRHDSTTARVTEKDGYGSIGAVAQGKRNRRSVWSIATKPYKGAHFAVFPSALVEPCILAGSRAGDIVLDPFMGSATTAEVAIELGRQFIGCELNAGYKPLQDERIAKAIAQVNEPMSAKVKRIKNFKSAQADARQFNLFVAAV